MFQLTSFSLHHLGGICYLLSSRQIAYHSAVTMIRIHPLSRMPSPQPVTIVKSTASTQTLNSEPATRGTQTLKGTMPNNKVDQTVGRPTVCSSNKVAARRTGSSISSVKKMSESKIKPTKPLKVSSTFTAPRNTRSSLLMRKASEEKATAAEKASPPVVKRPTSLKKVPKQPVPVCATETIPKTETRTDSSECPNVNQGVADRCLTGTAAIQADSSSTGYHETEKGQKIPSPYVPSSTSPSMCQVVTDSAVNSPDLCKPATSSSGAPSPLLAGSGWPGIVVGPPGKRSCSLSPGAGRQESVGVSDTGQLPSLDQSCTTNPELVDSGVFEDMSPSPVTCHQVKGCILNPSLELAVDIHEERRLVSSDKGADTVLLKSGQPMESHHRVEPTATLFNDKLYPENSTQDVNLKKERKKSKKRKKAGKNAVDEDGQSAKMPKKQPPNFFVAVQINDEKIMEWSRTIQKHVLSQNELLTSAAVPLATLHLTLLVLRLQEPDELLRACQALEESATAINDLIWTAEKFRIHSLGNFRHGVLFAHVYPGRGKEQLQRIADTVVEVFGRHGLLPSDNKAYKPHLTLMKLSRAPNLKKKGVSRIDPELYQQYLHHDLGVQMIQNVQLCAMLKPKQPSGYYQVEAAAVIGKQKRKTFTTEIQKILEWKSTKG